ncbi:MAG TPA: endonuclease/exonuclease/phosphatase family protein [Syntrophobacteraceae bacterium]|nr:endonuclease/exonuclease/phosphatase family protein [Syntrophobacteraceae bacterium]
MSPRTLPACFRVMTFNLRFENDRDGDHAWSLRKDFVVEVVKACKPAILGTQEGTPGQLDFLREHLPDYTMAAPDRPFDPTCQYPTLFYETGRFHRADSGEFWLSHTPPVHRSKSWDSAFPRMMGYGLLEDREVGKTFYVSVTHLDHLGAEARVGQARMIAEWIRAHPGPHILMGDFNQPPDSRVHEILTDPRIGLLDTWQVLGKGQGPEGWTHHDFHGVPHKFRMDWILAGRSFDVVRAEIVRDHKDGVYPSDHFPYWADLCWAS